MTWFIYPRPGFVSSAPGHNWDLAMGPPCGELSPDNVLSCCRDAKHAGRHHSIRIATPTDYGLLAEWDAWTPYGEAPVVNPGSGTVAVNPWVEADQVYQTKPVSSPQLAPAFVGSIQCPNCGAIIPATGAPCPYCAMGAPPSAPPSINGPGNQTSQPSAQTQSPTPPQSYLVGGHSFVGVTATSLHSICTNCSKSFAVRDILLAYSGATPLPTCSALRSVASNYNAGQVILGPSPAPIPAVYKTGPTSPWTFNTLKSKEEATKETKCECGGASVYGAKQGEYGHSDWCDWAKK
jgi:hypothetical protein